MITTWQAARPSVSGHQGKCAVREIANAILYQSRTGSFRGCARVLGAPFNG
ncbi:hypothetical protein O1Q96_17455 [Streptomyces sp. Qhu-G9]|uniref:hypothetical protein n=1 Tax=Streptomyces sp. Qhu-G9 TaxID=3452799 RepID=UPI0022AC2F23|nr:hypothetical protein [Streptomyces aurantiacus]WAU81414.1 hypothetical protein O1Q96_17455 [Streptomyces aurantiacus]